MSKYVVLCILLGSMLLFSFIFVSFHVYLIQKLHLCTVLSPTEILFIKPVSFVFFFLFACP